MLDINLTSPPNPSALIAASGTGEQSVRVCSDRPSVPLVWLFRRPAILSAATAALLLVSDVDRSDRAGAAETALLERGSATQEDRREGSTTLAFSAAHLLSPWIEMEGYRHLQPGWDGIDSVPPISSAIDDALLFLAALPPNVVPPEPSVSADGIVGWFWDAPDSMVNVMFPGQGHYIYYGSGGGKVARDARAIDPRAVPQELLDIIALA